MLAISAASIMLTLISLLIFFMVVLLWGERNRPRLAGENYVLPGWGGLFAFAFAFVSDETDFSVALKAIGFTGGYAGG
jgi:hypothetical protein